MNESKEDYLEAIVALEKEKGCVRPTDIAIFLGVSKPSVSRAIKKLEELGYIKHIPYSDITITEKGREKGSEILLRHTFLTSFLVDLIQVEKEVAQKEACKMEHVLSKGTMDKLKAFYIANTQIRT